jgi:surfactin synthase thioesterase subunit
MTDHERDWENLFFYAYGASYGCIVGFEFARWFYEVMP